ncbi:putative aarF domain-containing protein kinase 4 [Cyanidiococcus yangmingshanensis]|uniref:Putative aarF domain-containing protein kinase 4 n=1 Tax=Cyanidiococcus yangmingshanensis TaxID=2690220 RepID=A0A7J7IDV5_9RHOD|nr:putative aarF domain-containing protein kinase 4 [Cyanidiococcus yangmingshanensis]
MLTAPNQNALVRLADWSVVLQGARLVIRALGQAASQPGNQAPDFSTSSTAFEVPWSQLARSLREFSTEVIVAVSGAQGERRAQALALNSQRHAEVVEAAEFNPVEGSDQGHRATPQGALPHHAVREAGSSTPTGTLDMPTSGVREDSEQALRQQELFDKTSAPHAEVVRNTSENAPVSHVEIEIRPKASSSGEAFGTSGKIAFSATQKPELPADADAGPTLSRALGEARRVPATPFERMLGFGNLALGIVWNAAKSSVWSNTSTDRGSGLDRYLSPENADRIARTLCRMRGAALKLGQMLSMQDERTVPPILLQALERVRQGADFMPRRQLERVLRSEWGSNWPERVHSFEFEPVAAASIGQGVQIPIAVKVQYPGVAASIESDLKNLKRLLTFTDLIPRGLYLDEAIRVAREELLRECDYVLEAANQERFAAKFQGFDQGHVNIPKVIPSLSTRNILSSEWVDGVPLDRLVGLGVSAAQRNILASRMLRLTLHELFVERFMQTDPNFSNFLYQIEQDRLHLLDFGAARSYPKAFVDTYLRLVMACANRNRAEILEYSRKLGFLTGEESKLMLDAHCEAAFLCERDTTLRQDDIAVRAARFGQVMLQHRLCPPPREAYSLHRRLSGAFLTCMRLQAHIPCRVLLEEVYDGHDWSPEEESSTPSTEAN